MDAYYKDEFTTLYHGDCLELLPSISNVALVIADPPYSFGLGSSIEHKAGSWHDLMNNSTFYMRWLAECRRATITQQGAVWVFNSWRSFPTLARAAADLKWRIESLLVWDKDWIAAGGPKGLRPSYELVALFCQAGFAMPNRGLPDIWTHPWGAVKPTGHPAEKPLALCERLVKESGKEGGTVLDPFAGSGTTLLAAKNAGRRAIGIEADERFCEMAVLRLNQGVLPFSKIGEENVIC